jgi:hypothetical protein
VRASPVHAAAAGAAGERVIGAPGAGLQEGFDVRLGHRLQRAVARGAASPRGQRRREPVEYVAQLVIRVIAAHVGAQPQPAPAQQPAIPGEQGPVPGVRLLDEGVVVAVVSVGGVDAEQPQPAGERAQVHVQQEPCLGERLRPGYRGDGHPLAASEPVPGRQGPRAPGRTIHAQRAHAKRADLGQRHPERLHHMPQRRRPVAGHPHPPGAVPRRQEHPQFRREPQLRIVDRHPPSMQTSTL